MGSAVLLTYERHHHKRNLNQVSSMTVNPAMKTEQKMHKGYPLDVVPLGLPLTDGALESDGKQPHSSAQSSFRTSTNAPSETGSEDSCSFKKKSMDLNGDYSENNHSSAPAIYDVSHMDLTTLEKKDIRLRLKQQLDVILVLLTRLEAREMELKRLSHIEIPGGSRTDMYVTSTSKVSTVPEVSDYNHMDVPPVAGGKGKRVPKVNQLYVNLEFVSGNDKIPLFEKQEFKPAASLKRNLQEMLNDQDFRRQKTDSIYRKKMTEVKRQCKTLLKNLMSHKQGWIFNEPVDVVKLSLHDYFTIIQKPMDLGTIKTKLDSDKYCCLLEFAEDVRLTFDNAMLYNPKGHFVNAAADMLKKIFDSRWKSIELKVKELNKRVHLAEDSLPYKSIPMEVDDLPRKAVPGSNKISQNITCSIQKLNKAYPDNEPEAIPIQSMMLKEKCDLSRNIESLPNDKLEEVLHLIKSRYPNLKQTDDEIEVDIDSFDAETLRELQQVVDSWKKGQMHEKVQRIQDTEANKVQPSNGDSSVSMPKPLSRGGSGWESALGIDMFVVNHVPVAQEGATSEGKCTSLSNQSDGDVVADPNHAHFVYTGKLPTGMPLQEPVGSVAVYDQRSSSFLEIDTARRSVADAFEDNLSSKIAMLGARVGRGEGANNDGNVPPEKLLRAALLKSRFADTIIKAREKTLPLNKREKRDPERLKKEREELESRQREERARLQAEAELVRRRAETETAAQERRKREEQREAARLALQKMEKTVEIDENSQILKDLEMLRTIKPGYSQILSSGEDISPVHTSDVMPSFALQGGNPLEQLGLFMKIDDEDDEEHEKGSSPWQQQLQGNGIVGQNEVEKGDIED